jgi:hypothetical protein
MTCPGDGYEQLQRDPAQPAYVDEVAMTGAHGVAIDAGCSNLRPTSAFDGFIATHDERTRRRERRDEQPKQDPTRSQVRPNRAVEHPMIPLELGEIAQAGGTQHGTDHPSPWSQDGSDQEHLNMAPHGAREQRRERRERRQECDHVCREELHATTSFQEWSLAYPPFPFTADWIKSRSETV